MMNLKNCQGDEDVVAAVIVDTATEEGDGFVTEGVTKAAANNYEVKSINAENATPSLKSFVVT